MQRLKRRLSKLTNRRSTRSARHGTWVTCLLIAMGLAAIAWPGHLAAAHPVRLVCGLGSYLSELVGAVALRNSSRTALKLVLLLAPGWALAVSLYLVLLKQAGADGLEGFILILPVMQSAGAVKLASGKNRPQSILTRGRGEVQALRALAVGLWRILHSWHER